MDRNSLIAWSQHNGRLLVSPPSRDPLTLYDFKREPITGSWYQVPSIALNKEQRTNVLTETAKVAEISAKDALGFQGNFASFHTQSA